MNDIRIPLGLCEVSYDGQQIKYLADKVVFEAKPKYQTMQAGQGKGYILEDYEVSLTMSVSNELYETMKLANPSLIDHAHGMFDNPTEVNKKGKQLTIHPYEAGDSKKYDITIFSAIVDPKQPYIRAFDKKMDKVKIRFLGQPSKQMSDSKFKSYYFIGDVEKVGDS